MTLLDATTRGHSIVIGILLQYGADYAAPGDNNDNSSLHFSLWNDHRKIMDQLLQAHEKDPSRPRRPFLDLQNSNHGCMVIFLAAKKGKSSIVALLISYGADWTIPNIHKVTQLHAAACNGNRDLIVAMLENVSGGQDRFDGRCRG